MTERNYDVRKDSAQCYLDAIEAKRLRGDKHYPEPLNKDDRELDALKKRISRVQPVELPIHMLYPIREGSRIFVRINGEEIDLHPIQVGIIARAWTSALSGAYYAKCVEKPSKSVHD